MYVDWSALTIESSIDGVRAALDAPGRNVAIRHLLDAGWRVMAIADPALDAREDRIGANPALPQRLAPAGLEHVDCLPDGATGWLVTSDERQCRAARDHHGLRSILVAPGSTGRPPVLRTWEREARSLLDAVLVVLSEDAMPIAGAVAAP